MLPITKDNCVVLQSFPEIPLLSEATGIKMDSELHPSYTVRLVIQNVTLPNNTDLGVHEEEAYSLTVDPQAKSIHIQSSTNVGLFYGSQTLLSMISPVNTSQVGTSLPAVHIVDAPRFLHRGLSLDVARNFFSKGEIFKIIDTLAMYKMNKLHLHLSDDQGWRLEIPSLPELTEVKYCLKVLRGYSNVLKPYRGKVNLSQIR